MFCTCSCISLISHNNQHWGCGMPPKQSMHYLGRHLACSKQISRHISLSSTSASCAVRCLCREKFPLKLVLRKICKQLLWFWSWMGFAAHIEPFAFSYLYNTKLCSIHWHFKYKIDRNHEFLFVYECYATNELLVLVHTIDSSLIESRDRTVTWKYTTVGWPNNFGARFLSYDLAGIGNISCNDRLVSDLWLTSWFMVEFLRRSQ